MWVSEWVVTIEHNQAASIVLFSMVHSAKSENVNDI